MGATCLRINKRAANVEKRRSKIKIKADRVGGSRQMYRISRSRVRSRSYIKVTGNEEVKVDHNKSLNGE